MENQNNELKEAIKHEGICSVIWSIIITKKKKTLIIDDLKDGCLFKLNIVNWHIAEFH